MVGWLKKRLTAWTLPLAAKVVASALSVRGFVILLYGIGLGLLRVVLDNRYFIFVLIAISTIWLLNLAWTHLGSFLESKPWYSTYRKIKSPLGRIIYWPLVFSIALPLWLLTEQIEAKTGLNVLQNAALYACRVSSIIPLQNCRVYQKRRDNHSIQNTAELAEANLKATEQAEADRKAAELAEADRKAAEQAEADRKAAEQAEADRPDSVARTSLLREIQYELIRLGCQPGSADGVWGKNSAAAIERYGRATLNAVNDQLLNHELLLLLRDSEREICTQLCEKNEVMTVSGCVAASEPRPKPSPSPRNKNCETVWGVTSCSN